MLMSRRVALWRVMSVYCMFQALVPKENDRKPTIAIYDFSLFYFHVLKNTRHFSARFESVLGNI